MTDPEAFCREAVRLHHVWKKGQKGTDQELTDLPTQSEVNDAVEKSSRITFEQAEEQAWAEIEVHIGTMNPYELHAGACRRPLEGDGLLLTRRG